MNTLTPTDAFSAARCERRWLLGVLVSPQNEDTGHAELRLTSGSLSFLRRHAATERRRLEDITQQPVV